MPFAVNKGSTRNYFRIFAIILIDYKNVDQPDTINYLAHAFIYKYHPIL